MSCAARFLHLSDGPVVSNFSTGLSCVNFNFNNQGRVARLESEGGTLGERIWHERLIWVTYYCKKCSETFLNIFGPFFRRSENIPQNSLQVIHKICLQKFMKNSRRASAGAQGEFTPQIFACSWLQLNEWVQSFLLELMKRVQSLELPHHRYCSLQWTPDMWQERSTTYGERTTAVLINNDAGSDAVHIA